MEVIRYCGTNITGQFIKRPPTGQFIKNNSGYTCSSSSVPIDPPPSLLEGRKITIQHFPNNIQINVQILWTQKVGNLSKKENISVNSWSLAAGSSSTIFLPRLSRSVSSSSVSRTIPGSFEKKFIAVIWVNQSSSSVSRMP